MSSVVRRYDVSVYIHTSLPIWRAFSSFFALPSLRLHSSNAFYCLSVCALQAGAVHSGIIKLYATSQKSLSSSQSFVARSIDVDM